MVGGKNTIAGLPGAAVAWREMTRNHVSRAPSGSHQGGEAIGGSPAACRTRPGGAGAVALAGSGRRPAFLARIPWVELLQLALPAPCSQRTDRG